MLHRWILMVVVLLGVGSISMACGDSETNPPQQGDGGNGGNDNGDGGGDGGGDGNGDGDGEEPEPEVPSCEQLCDHARDECGWLDEESDWYAQDRATCIALCEDSPSCVPDAISACDDHQLEACFFSPDESKACTAMCDHIYYDCDMTFGVSRADCGVACTEGVFEEELVACFTASACEIDEMNACFEDEEPPVDACEAACAHVVDECGNETWSSTSCVRACKAAYTDEEKECLANLACDEDPIEACFGELSCQAMCDHVYNTCGSAIGDGDHESCEVLCRFNAFSDTEMTCFSSAACGDLAACDETAAP